MARPRQDLRQKTLLLTVFSNLRIGKLGKTRPWIFQSWAGALARSDAYGVFKWEPERMAILVWPYNSERQDSFPEDLELLAEGSAEDRVIQKYEVDGTWYGCFPHFEEHNSMERRGKPQLPFPPGTKSPWTPRETEKELEKKTEKETETELERNLGKPRLTPVKPVGSVSSTVSLAVTGETPVPPKRYDDELSIIFQTITGNVFDEDKLAISRCNFKAPKDAVRFAHLMVWAYTKSDYWPTQLSGFESFEQNLPVIEKQYDKFYAKAKKHPEDLYPDLQSIIDWRVDLNIIED